MEKNYPINKGSNRTEQILTFRKRTLILTIRRQLLPLTYVCKSVESFHLDLSRVWVLYAPYKLYTGTYLHYKVAVSVSNII